MAIIQSQASLTNMPYGWWPADAGTSVRLYGGYTFDYGTLYKTQPNVRICVDFLARNIAQLGLHVFRRDGESRVRDREHPLSRLLEQPLPPKYKMSRYRLFESLMGDLGVFSNAFWWKIQLESQESTTALLRIPPQIVQVKGHLYPREYIITVEPGKPQTVDPEEIVHFRTYNANSAYSGLSPLETLRQVLAEEHAAGRYRENFWKNNARISGLIKRPETAPEWSDDALERFRMQWKSLYTGEDNSGKTAILEDGMDWEPISFNPKEAEYLESRKLTREECARAFHIPPPLVGILDHATFSNIKEQHKSLYTDVLGPWLSLIEQDIQLQLLEDFGSPDHYVEFNLKEKLKGDFEEQTKALQSAVGRPWLTTNEARSLMNYPEIDGGDELVTPLNVLSGAQANPRDSAPEDPDDEGNPKALKGQKTNKAKYSPHNPKLWEKLEEKWLLLLNKTFTRQQNNVLPKISEKGKKATYDISVIWEEDRWNEELFQDAYDLAKESAIGYADYLADQLGVELDYDPIESFAENSANVVTHRINAATRDSIEDALAEEDPWDAVRDIFTFAVAVRASQLAGDWLNSLSSGGSFLAARQGNVTMKTWIVTSGNPRDSHSAIDGVTVEFHDTFPNGLRYPGDPYGSAEDNANCRCIAEYTRD